MNFIDEYTPQYIIDRFRHVLLEAPMSKRASYVIEKIESKEAVGVALDYSPTMINVLRAESSLGNQWEDILIWTSVDIQFPMPVDDEAQYVVPIDHPMIEEFILSLQMRML